MFENMFNNNKHVDITITNMETEYDTVEFYANDEVYSTDYRYSTDITFKVNNDITSIEMKIKLDVDKNTTVNELELEILGVLVNMFK